ncbi:hypothetical protein UlMin_023176 [Ulmus minor]
MLAVSSLSELRDEKQGEVESNFSIGGGDGCFADFGDGNLLDNIDFDDLFIGINDGDVLPDLDMDSEILAEFSAGSGEESEMNTCAISVEKLEDNKSNFNEKKDVEDDKLSGSGIINSSSSSRGEEIVSKRDDKKNNPRKEGESKGGRKSSSSSAQSKNSHGKRKVKVDWTPELHRRFVQAVEQLGVDKAVPSRILELMGIDCLTRHNIASHLQKYRSHRKHLLAREAEAATWSQRRQMYSSSSCGGTVLGKRSEMSTWVAPATMGFPPPMTPMHPHHFRPLHVWGHPTIDQTLMHVWPPKHQPHSTNHQPPPPPPAAWPPAPPLPDPNSYWHPHQRVPNAITPGAPCFPHQPLAPARFASPAVAGIPAAATHSMYNKVETGIGVTSAAGQSGPHSLVDFHPTKESIDAAIGDVLAQPWLPLPLGLKPPSIDCVMGELQRQGVPKVPPSCA